MRARRPGGRRDRGGATLIEFALLLPVFLAMMMGTFDVGWLFWQSAAIQVATQDGCRTGALMDPGMGRVYLADVLTAAEESMVARLEGLGIPCVDCEASARPIEVGDVTTLECSMTRTAGSLAGLLPDLDLESTILAQMEHQR